MKELQVRVDGMTCGGCARSIEKALESKQGVTSAHVDLASKTASVETALAESEIISAIAALGFVARVAPAAAQ